MRSRLLPLLSCLLLVSLAAPAWAKPTPEELASKVDKIFSEYGASSPGCALGVVRDGGLVYSKGYGLASLEHGVPLELTTTPAVGNSTPAVGNSTPVGSRPTAVELTTTPVGSSPTTVGSKTTVVELTTTPVELLPTPVGSSPTTVGS